jgi:hypothetical protein
LGWSKPAPEPPSSGRHSSRLSGYRRSADAGIKQTHALKPRAPPYGCLARAATCEAQEAAARDQKQHLMGVFSESLGGRPGAADRGPGPSGQRGSARDRRRSWPRPRPAHRRLRGAPRSQPHAGGVRRVRLVAIPQRHPSVVGVILASHASSAVRTVHDREHPAHLGALDLRCEALQYVPTVQHPQRLVISARHQRIVAHRSASDDWSECGT